MNLTEEAIAAIKGMLARGDRHHDVAVWFGVNQARVSEINRATGCGKKFRHVRAAPPESIPPPGPYVVVVKAGYDEMAMKAAAHQELVRQLELLLSGIRQNVLQINTVC